MADDTTTVDAIRAEIIVEVEAFAAAADMTHEVTVPHVAWMTTQIDALIAAVRAEHEETFNAIIDKELEHYAGKIAKKAFRRSRPESS